MISGNDFFLDTARLRSQSEIISNGSHVRLANKPVKIPSEVKNLPTQERKEHPKF